MKMMRNILFIILSVIFYFITNLSAHSQVLEIVIIPINYLERRGANFVQSTTTRDIARDLADHLNVFYNIRFDNTQLNDRLAGATDMDARRVADYYRLDNVIYGQIRDDGNSLTAEINAYSRRREDYGRFFASDSVNRYDRLIKNISEQILEWYNTDTDKIEALRNEIRDMQVEIEQLREELEQRAARIREETSVENEIEKELILKVPVNLGYWSYVERSWADQVQGTIGFTTGIQVFPELQMPNLGNMRNELSVNLNIGYRNGITRYKDEILLNVLSINPSFSYHLNIYPKNWLCIGTGIFYELGFWQINNQEFEEAQKYNQTLTGFSLLLEYSYQLNRLITMNFGCNMYGYFSRDTSLVVKPYLGTTITVFRRKYAD